MVLKTIDVLTERILCPLVSYCQIFIKLLIFKIKNKFVIKHHLLNMEHSMKNWMLYILFLLICSCATSGWRKPGVNKFDTESHLAQCEYDISMNKLEGADAKKTVDNCMKRNGFRYK
jgi:hypothetical protein